MEQIRRRAAVLGKPISHSLSPVIHNAGYVAAGLTDWLYTARECAEPELAGFVASLDDQWAGLSLTMPLKEAALAVADQVSALAVALGAVNTLHRRGGLWFADNTDAPGMVDALRWSEVRHAERVAVLGAGGTARAALAAAADLGCGEVAVYARRPQALDELRLVADRVGVKLHPHSWADAAVSFTTADLVVSTVPSGVADHLAGSFRARPGVVLFDVLYHPWPTPLAAAARAAGCTVVGGLELLLAQAARQFEMFTGVGAPLPRMRQALYAAAGAGGRAG